MVLDYFVEPLTVGRHNVLYVACILESSLNLEGCGTGLTESLDIVDLAHVLERQKMPLMLYSPAIGVFEVEFQPAELCALATVGRPSETIL